MVSTARTGHDGRPRVKRAAEELLQSLHRIVAIVEVPWVDVNDEVAQPQPYADVPPLRHRLCGIIDRHRIDDTPSLAGCLADLRSEEHTSELQSLMRISYAVFCLKKKITNALHDSYNLTYQLIDDYTSHQL